MAHHSHHCITQTLYYWVYYWRVGQLGKLSAQKVKMITESGTYDDGVRWPQTELQHKFENDLA